LPAIKPDDYIMLLMRYVNLHGYLLMGKKLLFCGASPIRREWGSTSKQVIILFQVEVTNLMANRIPIYGQKWLEWRKYHEINFVDINYKNFDASKWKVQPSGLGDRSH
jgi:hypothetical protein